MLSQPEVVRIQESFEKLVPMADGLIERFLENLFERSPEIRYLFPTDLQTHGRRLVHMLAFAVSRLDRWPELEPHLVNLGVRHVAYGVRPADYRTFAEAFLSAIAGTLGEESDPHDLAAWSAMLDAVSESMSASAVRDRWRAVVPDPEDTKAPID
jgi:nitric oxide dioxygenase